MTLKRKLTSEEKAQVLSLHSQGLTGPEIADQMHIDDARQVVGVIRAAVNFKRHPSMTPGTPSNAGAPIMTTPPPAPRAVTPEAPAPAPPPEALAPIQMSSAAVAPAPAPQVSRPVHAPQSHAEPRAPFVPALVPPASQVPQASVDGFGSSWQPASGYASGFNYNAPARKYTVYRDEPTQDGLLGEHADPFSEQDVAKTYGQGVYRVFRFDPGNPRPFLTQVRVSQEYGPPRFRNRQAQDRPGYGRWGQRPWFRSHNEAPREEDGVNEPQYERPRSAYDFARHSPPQSGDAIAAAIKAFGDLNVKALDQVDRAQRQGPDTFISKFFTEQQTQQRDLMEQQRRQDEQRRRDDDDRAERRQKEADREYQRRQEEEQKRHDRELEKIRLEMQARDKARDDERKMLVDLEDKRLQVIRDDHKLRQEALQDELKRNREEQRERETRIERDQKEREARIEKQLTDMRDATSAEIHEQQEKLQRELQREREQLDREQKLKEKHLDKEHELNTKILEVKQTQLENQGTNEVFTVVNNLINKFSSGLKEVVDLKKIEAAGNMSPEAQAAAVVHTMGDGKRQAEPEPAPAPAGAQGGHAAGSNGKSGQAADGTKEKAQEEPPMEEMVQQMVEQPFFQKVLKEWALHVRTGQDATTFVNMYMNWMNDPVDHEGRKATTMFANFIAPRPWAELYAIIKPKLKPEIIKIFDTKDAEMYYETFRALVTESIAAYWENVAAEREAVKAARRAAQKPAEKASEAQPAK